MVFVTIMTILSAFGSLMSGILALVTVLIQIPIFILRATGVMTPTAVLQLTTRLDRTIRILSINAILSANQWHGGRPLEADEASLLREELDLLVNEEIAAIRAARHSRGERGEKYRQIWRQWVTEGSGWVTRAAKGLWSEGPVLLTKAVKGVWVAVPSLLVNAAKWASPGWLRRGATGVWVAGQDGFMMVRGVWGRIRREHGDQFPAHEEDGGEGTSFVGLELTGIPMDPLTRVASRRSARTRTTE